MTQKPTNTRWRILLVLALASFVSYVLRSNISIAAPTMIRELQLTEIQWGWVLAAFTAGYAIFQFPGGVFSDKVGPRKALTIIALLWTLFTVLTALIPGAAVFSVGISLGLLIVVRFLIGVVHAPIFPLINTSIGHWFPSGKWGMPLGLSSVALTLGAAAAAPVIAWLNVHYGWRISFLVISPLGLIVAAIWWWYARDAPADHPSVNSAEHKLIAARRPEAGVQPKPMLHWQRILKDRNLLLLTLSYTCSYFVFYEVFNWFYYYLVEVRSFGAVEAGLVISFQWLAGAAGAFLGGWLCDTLSEKYGLRWGCRWPIAVGLVLTAAALTVGALHSNPIVTIILFSVFFFFQQITESAYWVSSIAVGNQFAGAAGGLINTGGNVAGFATALLVPWFASAFGWTFAIASGAIFALLGAILILFVRSDEAIAFD